MFKDRQEAGQLLGQVLIKKQYRDVVVVAIPRGGVVIGFEIAKVMQCPLSVVVVRKIGAPDQPELALEAIAEGDVEVLNDELIEQAGYQDERIREVIIAEREELVRRVKLYKVGRKLPLKNKTVIIVDDGLATGMTALAAIESVKKKSPKQVVFAVPVGATESLDLIRYKVDDLICLRPEEYLGSIGEYYIEFSQVGDEDVLRLLKYKGGEGF